MLNVYKLRGAMAEAGITQRTIAKAIGKAENTVTKCFTGKRSFDVEEADIICDLLGITDSEKKAEIFLAKSSQK